ncbi:hypothetical protein [Clostridium sp. CF012]|uniref:hypothetical protein n=1 Tax=Clostridium sp. CF012 TaxID=2843319 RepID=UPI001C0D09FB|nr:hypothetical protein [Clostridium sp. CF012]MBU3144260.1 hypothetical protein [Clostridium sp. CF012]
MSKDEKDNKLNCSRNNNNECDCDLCSTVNVDPVDIEKHGAKLLTTRIQVNNVCFGKTVSVACIIYDNSHRILAFRGFTTRLCKEDACANNACGTITRKLVFVLPADIEDPEDLDIRCAANYIYPCE